MNEGKYIITNYLGHSVPVLFSNLLSHLQIAERNVVTSAGFFTIIINDKNTPWIVDTYGKSISLKIESMKGDGKIIKDFLLRTVR